MFQRGEYRDRIVARRHAKTRRDKRVRRHEIARQWQTRVNALPGVFNRDQRRGAHGARIQQSNVVALGARREHAKPARARMRDGAFREVAVGVDDRGLAGREQGVEQTHFRGEVIIERRVIIEMIAGKVREGARGEPHAIEPALIEPVRGGLHRQMRNALGGEFVQRAMQRHRIGRGQRAIGRARGLDDARGAERRRRVAQPRPDLARERRGRSLAARAGDGHDG